MATNFPSSADSFTNPTAGDTLDNPPHDQQHANINDAMEAVQASLLDGAPLHIDDANERVGIGTASPATTLEVDGVLTANHIHGNIAGAVYLHVKNTSGVTIPAGSPVYATGSVGASGETEVAISDADNASTMPALGIVDSELVDNAEGHATVLGVAKGLDTSAWSVNDSLYVSTSGGLTNVRPTGASELVQKIGRVIRSHASTGEVLVLGAGRSNDVPNNIVAGGLTIDTDTLHVDATNNRVGIGTTSPQNDLHIQDGSSGATADTGTYTQFVVEDSTNAGIHLISPDTGIGRVIMGTPSRQFGSLMRWDYPNLTYDIGTDEASGEIAFRTGNFTERMRIDSSGDVTIGGNVSYANQGLVLLKTINITNYTGWQDVTGCWSSAYKNYRVAITGGATVGGFATSMQVTGAGSNHYSTTRYFTTGTTTEGTAKITGATYCEVGGSGGLIFDLINVGDANEYIYYSSTSSDYTYTRFIGGKVLSTAIPTTIRFSYQGGTFYNATIEVYGYNR